MPIKKKALRIHSSWCLSNPHLHSKGQVVSLFICNHIYEGISQQHSKKYIRMKEQNKPAGRCQGMARQNHQSNHHAFSLVEQNHHIQRLSKAPGSNQRKIIENHDDKFSTKWEQVQMSKHYKKCHTYDSSHLRLSDKTIK